MCKKSSKKSAVQIRDQEAVGIVKKLAVQQRRSEANCAAVLIIKGYKQIIERTPDES